MKFLIALFALTSFSAFADLQQTLNNLASDDENIKKALYNEITQKPFVCTGVWNSPTYISSILTSPDLTGWKITYTVSNVTPTILAEAKFAGGKLAFTFQVTQDLKAVNAFTYQQWTVTVGEKNTGTLMKPIFVTSDILSNEQTMNCRR